MGKRELARLRFGRKGSVALFIFNELKLELEDSEIPEAYDLRFCSGVARAEDGVMLLPKVKAGD